LTANIAVNLQRGTESGKAAGGRSDSRAVNDFWRRFPS
jgi:hypothetical protein